MNEKFFSLPIEKQETIINAGYRGVCDEGVL